MEDGIPIIGPDVDLSKAPPINHKRTLAFLNHFVTHTVRFLNKFSCVCEEKLANLQVRVQRLEVTLSILEAKLSSIPGLDQIAAAETSETASGATTSETTTTATSGTSAPPPIQDEEQRETEPEPEKPSMTVSKDERYMKFFKMLNYGVPPTAIKGKMAAEGLNPDLLDTPDAPAPEGGTSRPAATEDSDLDSDANDDSSDEASSFSDSD